MPKRPRPPTYEDKLHIDMPFNEALQRFIGADPKELAANIEKSKATKPPTDRKLAAAGKPDQTNVAKLRGKSNKPR
jgi:hypothetical protein